MLCFAWIRPAQFTTQEYRTPCGDVYANDDLFWNKYGWMVDLEINQNFKQHKRLGRIKQQSKSIILTTMHAGTVSELTERIFFRLSSLRLQWLKHTSILALGSISISSVRNSVLNSIATLFGAFTFHIYMQWDEGHYLLL